MTEASRTPLVISRVRIKESAMSEFNRRKETSNVVRLWKSNWLRSAVFGAIILSLVPIIGNERSAGELQPSGLVEIVRDGEVFIASGNTRLKIGDQVLVGNNASAEINMRHSIQTTAGNQTELRITKPNSLFLVKGNLSGNFENNSSIATDRGQISGSDASLSVAVSETGETYIQPSNNNIHVTTWDNQKATLIAGEELRLHTDATLPAALPKNLNLSSSQILAISAKLLISRTKALNALENRLNGEPEKAIQELESADRSFLSVVQVLKSSRNLEIVRRENLDLVSRADVVERITARTTRTQLIADTRAVEALLDIIDSEYVPNFKTETTELRIFNRYVLLQRLFAPLAVNSRVHGALLQEQYINALAHQISESLDPEQEIKDILAALPQNSAARKFRQEVAAVLPNNLALFLQ